MPPSREFRYDGARARYLNRKLDPVALMAGNFVSLEDVWTDYDGSSPYGDYEVTPGNPPTVTNKRSYQPGLAVGEWGQNNVPPTASSTDYFVTDHLGTTRGMTLPSGFPDQGATFTAFGEKITGADHRYGYVGAHGYQAQSEMPYLHVGARYYDPASGRFLQRDPIGILGGLNAYGYVRGIPTIFVDPLGFYGTSAAHPEGVVAIAEIEAILGGAGAATAATGAVIAGAALMSSGKEAAAEAGRAYHRNDKFRRWYHRTYKDKVKTTRPDHTNPNLDPEDLQDAWELFKELFPGCV